MAELLERCTAATHPRGPMSGTFREIRPECADLTVQAAAAPAAAPATPEAAACVGGQRTCGRDPLVYSHDTCFSCVQACDNCYNWASNTLTNLNALPGVTPPSGSPLLGQWPWAPPARTLACPFEWEGAAPTWDAPGDPGLPTCGRMHTALVGAGWKPLPNGAADPPEPPTDGGHNMLAMISKPSFGECQAGKYRFGNIAGGAGQTNGDMHFVRQDADGSWSQKPGDGDVRDTDCSGKPIGSNPWPGAGGDASADYRLFANSTGITQACGVAPPADACPVGAPPTMGSRCTLPQYEYQACGYYQAPAAGVQVEGSTPAGVATVCKNPFGTGTCELYGAYIPPTWPPVETFQCADSSLQGSQWS